ncbi:hypothetical protein LWI28_013249 [Acer negundo]|uniref:non-specific serine/threonine protein kinase n=1 Tax=Acer negundo TaxID=4023 RepID=A0AAD5NEQ7_ACENE|nr:hypothetical protein LWI28_013249 [Acer negundo]
MKNLQLLDLSYNNLGGPIPATIGNLTNLTSLFLRSNQLFGSLPKEIGNLQNLTYLHLSNNNLVGPVPSFLGHLTNLTDLYLDSNQLSGSIPSEIGNMNHLASIDMSRNNIYGTIPNEINQLSGLTLLNLSSNILSSQTLFIIAGLFSLEYLGLIPRSLNITIDLDLSFNNLEGEIPSDLLYKYPLERFRGYRLCGQYVGLPSRNPSTSSISLFIRICAPVISVFAMMILVFPFLFKRKGETTKVNARAVESKDVFSIWNYDGRIVYEDVIKATEDFDLKYCIERGGYGNVYKAQLPSGKIIALKKFHHSEIFDEPLFLKSFENEVSVLSEIRHRNIVKLYGFCMRKKNMFLVYEYMEKGSLFCILRNNVDAVELDWIRRLKIIKGIAHALAYLHHNCTSPIVHRDISCNNILLNSESEAFVADFGFARLLHSDSSNRSAIAGTFGYMAPDTSACKTADPNLIYRSTVYTSRHMVED